MSAQKQFGELFGHAIPYSKQVLLLVMRAVFAACDELCASISNHITVRHRDVSKAAQGKDKSQKPGAPTILDATKIDLFQ